MRRLNLSRRKKLSVSSEGFTLVELMIASVVFSIILVLVTVGIVQITRTYYKGVTTTKTEQAARSIIDQVSQSIQLSGGTTNSTPMPAYLNDQFVCINDQRFTYRLGQEVPTDGSRDGLVVDGPPTGAQCTAGSMAQDLSKPSSGLAVGSRELLQPNMRLTKFSVTNSGDNLWHITVRVVYGDDDLICNTTTPNECASSAPLTMGPDLGCRDSSGSQFCAVSELSTVVQKRLQ